jgi:thioredoxin-like negative regulator of GroEL
VLDGWLGLVESLERLGRERDGDLTLDRARRLFGGRPEIVLLVAKQLLRRGAFDEAEAILAPLTSQEDPKRSAVAWAWVGVARLGGGKAELAANAAEEALLADPSEPIARFVLDRTRGLGLAQ